MWWLSELALFDFMIKYQTGHCTKATAVLSHHPFSPNQKVRAKQIMTKGWFIDIIYDHPGVSFLHDKDFRFSDYIRHTIQTMTDKPVYLVHHIIPPQLQTELHQGLDSWLVQGIIRPLQSHYTSQVVIVQQKSAEIPLCFNYQKLSSIMIRNAFPLPRIDNALQAINSSNWFLSFDVVQG